MLVNVYGTVLNVHTGVSKSSGKSFRMADIYDGEDQFLTDLAVRAL